VNRVGFRVVDVFSPTPFAGNQLCVVPEGGDLDGGTMQRLAREIGFSETTFVTQAGGGRYAMRIFTPGAEVPFAGHPTIGTAFALASEGRIGATATQVVAAGEIEVEVDVKAGRGRMRQLLARFGPEVVEPQEVELIAAGAGLAVSDLHPDLPAQVVWTGLAHLLVPVRDPGALRRAERDPRPMRDLLPRYGAESLYLFVVEDDGIVARMFDPDPGIGEDPATGSAAGPLGAYLAERGLAGLPGEMLVRQGEQTGRPSELHVEVHREGDSWRAFVGGGVHLVADGAFLLP
jgi:trans-2,3-dihydro-3-hydroxyanthranilate isomerase